MLSRRFQAALVSNGRTALLLGLSARSSFTDNANEATRERDKWPPVPVATPQTSAFTQPQLCRITALVPVATWGLNSETSPNPAA